MQDLSRHLDTLGLSPIMEELRNDPGWAGMLVRIGTLLERRAVPTLRRATWREQFETRALAHRVRECNRSYATSTTFRFSLSCGPTACPPAAGWAGTARPLSLCVRQPPPLV